MQGSEYAASGQTRKHAVAGSGTQGAIGKRNRRSQARGLRSGVAVGRASRSLLLLAKCNRLCYNSDAGDVFVGGLLHWWADLNIELGLL